MLCADVDDNLVWRISEVVFFLQFLGDGRPKLDDAGGGGVFCSPGAERLDSGSLYELGSIEIGFAGCETDDIDTLCL